MKPLIDRTDNALSGENLEFAFDPDWQEAALAKVHPDVVWAYEQMKKVAVRAAEECGVWQAFCPVCGDEFLIEGRTPQPLRREIRDHLLRNSPAGVEHAKRQIGDRISIQSRLYEVHDGPFRAWANPQISPHLKAHTFFVVLRRLDDGRFFTTIPGNPVALKPRRRPRDTCLLDRWRKLPYFRLIDRRGLYIFDTDNPTLAARAYNRLLDVHAVDCSPHMPPSRMKDFDDTLRRILESERKNMEIDRESGWRTEKAFSLGMRRPWPPEENFDEEYALGRYNHTFNIIEASGRPIYSTDECQQAAEVWNNCGVPAGQGKAGVVISGCFVDPKEIAALLSQFQDLLNWQEI